MNRLTTTNDSYTIINYSHRKNHKYARPSISSRIRISKQVSQTFCYKAYKGKNTAEDLFRKLL